MRSLALLMGVWLVLASTARAQQTSPPDLTAEGNRLLAEGKYAEALAAYERAAEALPGSAELAYNRGVAQYRLGDYERAADFFGQALSPGNAALDAKARFNLGNCAYATGLTQQQADPAAAIQKLEEAVGHYADALELTPEDRDACENIERAQRLVEELRKLQQQQQQQQNDRQSSDPNQPPEPQKQDQQQNQQDPNQPPTSQPQQDQQQDQQKQDQQQQDQQRQGEQQADQQKQDEQQQQQNADQNPQGEQDPQDQAGEQQAQQAQPVELKPVKPDEAERMLQAIRDKDRQRREALARQQRQRTGHTPVSRDW